MKKFFKILTVAQLAFQAYNFYMEHQRKKQLKQIDQKIDRAI
ncbi:MULTISPECIES: hypothetical protein [Nonlabens]